jgi:hypothetical protein
MSPSSFTFKLTVPNGPEGVAVVGVVATHTVEYTNLDAAVGVAFVKRVRDVAALVLEAANVPAVAVFAAANGQLTITIGGQSVSQPLPA